MNCDPVMTIFASGPPGWYITQYVDKLFIGQYTIYVACVHLADM